MAITINSAPRVFKLEDETLDDPNPNLSVQEVRKLYSAKHPELTNANVSGPVMENDKAVYTFGASVGKKG